MTDTASSTIPHRTSDPHGTSGPHGTPGRRRTLARTAVLPAILALAAGPAIAGCSASGGSHGTGSGSGATTGQPPAAAGASGAAGDLAGTGAGGGGPATADVTVSGSVSGHLDNPTKGPKYTCGAPTVPDLWGLYDVEGTVGGTRYLLQISVNNFTGSGKQTGQTALTLAPTSGGPQFSSINVSSTQPTVVMADKQSGTFEGDLATAEESGAPSIHLKGSFHC